MAHNRTLFLTVAIVGVLFLSVGVGLVAAQDGGDWSQFQSDEGNTGHNSGGIGPTDSVQTRWTPFSTGGEARSPVVVGGTAYFGSTDDSVYAVDTSTGNQEWKFGTSGDVKTPAVDSGIVYVGSQGGRVYALDASDGMKKWEWEFPKGGASGAPTVANGVVYVPGADDRFFALDASNGSELWSIFTDECAGGQVQTPAVSGSTVYITEDCGKTWAVDGSDGSVKWKFDDGSGRGQGSPPTVKNGTVYFGTVKADSPEGNTVFAVDAATGNKEWEFSFTPEGDVKSSPAVANGKVFFGSRNGNVYALDASDGSQIWDFSTGGNVRSSPAVADDTVYVGSKDGNLYGIDTTTGGESFSFDTGGSIRSSPAVVNGVAYVGSRNGNMYALESSGSSGNPANFEVTVDTTNSPVTEGDTLTVDATITNTGDESGTQTITAEVPNVGSNSMELTIAAESSMTETFSIPTESGDSGDYTLTVSSDNDTASTSVRVDSGEGDDPRIICNPADDEIVNMPEEPSLGSDITFELCPDTIESVSWDFGDGSASQGNPVSYSYSEEGTYTVTANADGTQFKKDVIISSADFEILNVDQRVEGTIIEGLPIKNRYVVQVSSEAESVSVQLAGDEYDGETLEDYIGLDGDFLEAAISRLGIEVRDPERTWIVDGVELDELDTGTVDAVVIAEDDTTDVTDERVRTVGVAERPGWFETIVNLAGDSIEAEGVEVEYVFLDSETTANAFSAVGPWDNDFASDASLSVSILAQPDGNIGLGGGGEAELSVIDSGVGIEGELGAELEENDGSYTLGEVRIDLTGEVERELWSIDVKVAGADVAKAEVKAAVSVTGDAVFDGGFSEFKEAGAGLSGRVSGGTAAAGTSVDITGELGSDASFVLNSGNWVDRATANATVKGEGGVEAFIYSTRVGVTLIDENVCVIGCGDAIALEEQAQTVTITVDSDDWSVVSKRGDNPGKVSLSASDAVTQDRLSDRRLTDGEPAITDTNDGEAVVWTRQLKDRSVEEGQDIVARMGDGRNVTVTDNDRHDFDPDVAGDGDLVAAWTQVNADLTGVDNPFDVFHNQTIAFSRYDSSQGRWEQPELLTETENMERNPSVEFHDSNWLVAWERDTGNATDTADRDVKYALLNASGVESTGTVENAQQPDVGVRDSGFELAYYERDTNTTGDVVRGTFSDGPFSFVEEDRYAVSDFGDLSTDGGQTVWVAGSGDEPRLLHDDGTGTETEDLSLPADISSVRAINLEAEGNDALLTYRGKPGTQERSDLIYRLAKGGEWIADRRVADSEDGLVLQEPDSVLKGDSFRMAYAVKEFGVENKSDVFTSTHEFRPDYTVDASRPDNGLFGPGDSVPVGYEVRNVGDVDGTETVPVAIISDGNRLAEQTVGPINVNETVSGEFNVTMDETGTFNVVVDPDNEVSTISVDNPDEWLATQVNVSAASPGLSVSSVDVSPVKNGIEVTPTIINQGGVPVENLFVQYRDGEGPVRNGTVDVQEYGTGNLTMNIDPNKINHTLSDTIVLDPERERPEDNIRRRSYTTWLLQPDVSLSEPVAFEDQETGGTLGVITSNRGSVTANATVEVLDESGSQRLAVTETEIPAPVGTDAVFKTVEISSDSFEVGDKVSIQIDTERYDPDVADTALTYRLGDLFTKSLIDRFEDPPQNIPADDQEGLDDTLYEDLDGDGSGTDVDQTVAVFGELIRGKDLNGDAPDGGLTDEQARALNWNQNSPETEVTPADMVSLFGEQIRAG